jgi:hypothetical protein
MLTCGGAGLHTELVALRIRGDDPAKAEPPSVTGQDGGTYGCQPF